MYSISTSYALRDVIQIKSGMYTRVLNFISRHCLDYLASGIITDNTLGVYRSSGCANSLRLGVITHGSLTPRVLLRFIARL